MDPTHEQIARKRFRTRPNRAGVVLHIEERRCGGSANDPYHLRWAIASTTAHGAM
jgi:hypothetical protein